MRRRPGEGGLRAGRGPARARTAQKLYASSTRKMQREKLSRSKIGDAAPGAWPKICGSKARVRAVLSLNLYAVVGPRKNASPWKKCALQKPKWLNAVRYCASAPKKKCGVTCRVTALAIWVV